MEGRADPPPELGGVAAPSIKWREATELGADGVVPLERPASNSFGTTPPARPFLEFDGLAGTPPNSGGEFQTRNCNWFTPSHARATLCRRSRLAIAGASSRLLPLRREPEQQLRYFARPLKPWASMGILNIV